MRALVRTPTKNYLNLKSVYQNMMISSEYLPILYYCQNIEQTIYRWTERFTKDVRQHGA